MTHLQPGAQAPDFEFIRQSGDKVSLKSLRGKRVILYFYPKDNTPGCTAEACNLRDNYSDLVRQGFEVIGVSADNEKSHANFRGKHNLPFELISDTEKEILQKYGAWGEKKMMGRTYMGIHRITFVIDQNGLIERIYTKVKTGDHTAQILDDYK